MEAIRLKINKIDAKLAGLLSAFIRTKTIGGVLLDIFLVSSSLFSLGCIFVFYNNEFTLLLLFKLFVKTSEFTAWFLFGYSGFQALGYEKEIKQLDDELNDIKHEAGIKAFNVYDETGKDDLNNIIIKINRMSIDVEKQKRLIENDKGTSIRLLLLGVVVFMFTTFSNMILLVI